MILKEQNSKTVYSDGEAIENQLFEIAKSYPEDAAEDFISNNSQYSINNTFSSVRKNLLNWYPFKDGVDILEVGAGAGSMTGLLCDKANSVVSLEMSEARTRIIRARYPNRKNLTVISDNILDWHDERKFDYVVFVGVLEYAAVFSDSKEPFVDFLKAVCSHLKADGILLFAIENRFGLKYWLGASEDHLQKPFVGIEGYKEKKTPQTFSKETLRNFCLEAGLNQTRFYSVYPDYKFPEIICVEGYKPNAENLRKVNFTYSRNSALYADERDLYVELTKNGVSDFFANSFLVEASLSKLSDVYPVFAGGKGEVKKEYRVSTVIYNDNKVLKIPVHNSAIQHIKNIVANTNALKKRGVRLLDIEEKNGNLESSFYTGVSAQDYFSSLLEKNDFTAVCDFLTAYKKEVLRTSEITADGNIVYEMSDVDKKIDFGPILKDGYVDLTFYNAFFQNGVFVFYDQEWKFDNVPLLFILFYAVKSSYARGNAHTNITLNSLYDFLGITTEQADIFEKLESYIWQKIFYRSGDFYGEDGYCNRYGEKLTLQAHFSALEAEMNNKSSHIEQLLQSERELKGVINKMEQRMDDDKKIISELTAQIEQLNCEISALYNSQSWKITAPLRFMKSIIRKIYTILFPCRLYNVIRIFRRYGIVGVIKKIVQKIRERQCRKLSAIYNPTLVNSSSYDTISIPVFDDIRVSIIIPVYNQFDYTYKCISSIVNTVKNITYEIIIGDDMSTDETKRIAEFFPNVRVNKNESDHGFLMNCNRAAKLAKGKYILFLNNDTQVQEDWLSSLVSLIESDEKIGMVGSKLVYPDGTLQEAGGIIWSDASGWNYGRGNNATLPEYNYVKEVDYISGASIMIRSSLWNAIGGFDERYKPAYYEDSDLAFEVRKHGFKVMYQPKSVVVHFEGVSNGTDLTSGLKKYQVDNREKFVAKWADELKGQCPPEPEKYLFRARDRSFGKKSILVVDHYVPNFDKDAGGRCTYMYMKIFQKLGMKVSFIGDNFAKIEPYASILTQGEIEFLCGNWYCIHWKEWLKDNLKNFDFVYLQRPHIAIKYIDLVKENCDAKVFYFAHDLHHIRLYREYKVSGDEKKLSESEHWKKIEMELFEKSDVGHVVGSYEQKIMQERMPEKPIRNIPLYIYESQLENVEKDFSKRSGLVFVGGFNHTPNKDAVLWFVNEIYPQILKEYPDMVFHIVGSNTPDEIKKLQSKNIKVEGFLSDADLHSLYQSCRLAVVPLRYGAGVKGKIVEAAYNQIPLVTTSIGGEGIDSSVGAFLMEDDAGKMAELICSLYKDFEKLRHMSDSGKQLIEKCFTEKTAQAVLLQDLE